MKKFANKKVIGISAILVVIIIVLFVLISNSSYAVSNCSTSDRSCYQNALINTVNAYKYREYNLQYDDAKMTYNNDNKKVQRSECAFSPEEATNQHVKYASCSPFLWSIYYETFVKNGNHYQLGYGTSKTITSNSNHFVYMANPEKTTYLNKDVAIYNISVSGSFASFSDSGVTIKESVGGNTATTHSYGSTDSFKTYVMNKIKSYIQVGDIIGYIYTGGGGSHVVMVTEITRDSSNNITDFKVAHSYNGSSYEYDKKYDYIGKSGTVAIWNEESFKNGVFKMDGTKIDRTSISIIRPLNEIIGNYNLSDNTKARLDYYDLSSQKLASVEEFESINPGDIITYTIRLKNNSSSDNYTGITIRDVVPTNTTFVSCTNNCSSSGGNITWTNVSVNKGKTVNYEYTVKVNDNTSVGTIITSNSTVVAGVPLNKIETVVNKTFTKEMQEEFSFNVLSKVGDSYSSTIAFLTSVYSGYGANLNISFSSLFSKFFTANGTSGNYTTYLFNQNVKDGSSGLDAYQKMYVRGLFGGRYVDVDNFSTTNELMPCKVSDGRNKTYRDYTFMIGDIVLLKDTNAANEDYVVGTDNLYLYAGDGIFLTVKEGKVHKIDEKIFRYYSDVCELPTTIPSTIECNSKSFAISKVTDDLATFTINDVTTTGPIVYRFIDSLIGQNAFVVLRPSQVMTQEVVIDNDIKLDVFSDDDLTTYSNSKTFKIKISDPVGNLTAGTYNIKYRFGYSGSNYTCNDLTESTTINVKNGVSSAESTSITVDSGNYSRIYMCNVNAITGTGISIPANTVISKVLKIDANKPSLNLVPTDKDSLLTNRSSYAKSQKIKFRLYDEYSGLKKGTYTIKYKAYTASDSKPACSDMTDSVQIVVSTDGETAIQYSDYISFSSGNYRYIAWCNAEEIKDILGNKRDAGSLAYNYDLKVDSVSPKSGIVDDNRKNYAKSQTFQLKLTDTDGSGLKAGTYVFKYKVYGKNDSKPSCDDMTDYVNIVVPSDGIEEALSKSVTISNGDYEYISWCNDTAVSDVVGNTRSIGSIYSIDTIFRVSNTAPNITNYSLKGNFIIGVNPKTNISNFDLDLDNRYTVKILDRNDNIKTSGYIGTGYKVQIYLGEDMLDEYIIVIKGDINGDGQILVNDVANLYRGLINKVTLADYEIEAGNIIDDNILKISDIAKLYKYIKGKIKIL